MAFIKHLLNDSISLEGTFVLNGSAIVKSNGTEAFSGDQSMGGFRLLNVGTPVLGTSAANKDYVDNFVLGLSWKAACRAATTANIVLSGLLVIDGVTLVANDRVLVKNQTLPKDNGIYVAAAGAWTRATDADTADKLESAAVAIKEGLTNADTRWTQTNDNFIIGTDPITWVFIGAGAGVVAATFVVSTTPNVGDYTDIQSAIDALPAAGGLIFLREGTYNLSATVLYTDKPIAIRGCGIGNTIISVGANAIPAFTMPGGLTFGQSFVIEDLTIIGTGLAGQKALRVQSDVSVVLSRVDFQSLDLIFDATGSAPSGKFSLCTSLSTNQLWASTSGVLEVHSCTLYIDGATGISGSPTAIIADSRLNTFAGPYTVAIAALSIISNSRLVAGIVTPTGVNCRFVGSAFNSNGLVFTVAGGHTVAGCLFESMTTGIAITTTDNNVTGCVFSGVTNPVLESGAAQSNKYTGNKGGFGLSTIIGVNSIVDGTQRHSASGATTGSFAVIMGRVSILGLLAIGTIKNTGADSLEVRETGVDAFGVTDTVTTTVLSGNDYMLDAQTNLMTARPPYLTYQVEVRHPGAATTYSLRHVTHGAEYY